MIPCRSKRAALPLLIGLVCLSSVVAVDAANAQAPGLRPSDSRPELPPLEDEDEQLEPPPLALPPVAPAPEPDWISSGLSVAIDRFRFEGNTAFSDAELAPLVSPCIGEPITTGDLERCRQAVTRHYVDAGYTTSGALLPPG